MQLKYWMLAILAASVCPFFQTAAAQQVSTDAELRKGAIDAMIKRIDDELASAKIDASRLTKEVERDPKSYQKYDPENQKLRGLAVEDLKDWYRARVKKSPG